MENMSNHSSERNIWLDEMKGLTIILVVLGHVLEGAIGKEILRNSILAEFIDNSIGLFHMPLFFVLSGIAFSYLKDRIKICKQCCNILILYFFWSIIMYVLKELFPSIVNVAYDDHILLCLFCKPISPYWYFLVLFDYYLIHSVLNRTNFCQRAELVFATILSGIAPLFWTIGPDKLLSYVYRLTFNFIFFLLGTYLRKYSLDVPVSRMLKSVSKRRVVAVVLVLFAILISLIGNCEKLFYIPFFKTFSVLCCLLLFLTGSYSLLCSEKNIRKWQGCISYFGNNVIYIYVLHNYLTVAIRVIYIRSGIILPDILYVSINLCITIAVCCMVAEICKRVQILNVFFMPVKVLDSVKMKKTRGND